MGEVREDIVLYDWLSFTLKETDPGVVISLLGLEHLKWQKIKGARGYQDRMYFDGISIHYHGREDMGVWCEMSGQGCRDFEEFSDLAREPAEKWRELFAWLAFYPAHVTRLDVAYDDHTGKLNIAEVCDDTRKQNYVSPSKWWEVVESSQGQSLYIGSPQSKVRIRIYDKARERHCPEGEHWIRVELQLRDERAQNFLTLPWTIGENFANVVLNYLRYVTPDPEDSNKSRWDMKEYWNDFLAGASAVSIYEAPGIEYNLDRLQHFVVMQAGNAIDALLQIKGPDEFWKAIENRPVRKNPKYDILVEKEKKKQGESGI